MSFEKVVVGIDFSPACLVALREACELAPEAVLSLVHAIDGETAPEVREALETEAYQGLDAIAADLRASGLRSETRVVRGRPAAALLAETIDADLIAVGTHGRRGLDRLRLGSVAEEVARRTRVPALIVKEDVPPEGRAARVLVAVDAEPLPGLIAFGAKVADVLRSRLEVLHVVPAPGILAAVGGSALARLERDPDPALALELRTATARETAAPAELHIRHGSPADRILEAARPTDVLVCGTRGRSRLLVLAFGSVARDVVRRAPCPVLVVPPAPAARGEEVSP